MESTQTQIIQIHVSPDIHTLTRMMVVLLKLELFHCLSL